MNALRSLPLAALACLALAGAAGATSWSPPVTVGATAKVVSDPILGFASHGSALLGARFLDDPGPFRQGELQLFTGRHTVSSYPAIGSFGEQFRALRSYGARRAILVLGRVLRRDRNSVPTVQLSYRIGTASGRFGDPHTLWTGRLQGDPVIAASNDGDIAIAWNEVSGEFSNRRLWLARRTRNAPFHRPAVLAGSSNPSSPSLAWDADGNLLVGFNRQFRSHGHRVRDVAVRVRRAGHPFGPVRTIGPSRGYADITAGMSPGGRMYVAWGTQDGGEEAGEPWRVYAATAINPAHRFAPAVALDPGAAVERPAGRVVLVVGNDGSATVGWSGIVRTAAGAFSYPARVADADANGRFASGQQLSPSAAMEDLAIGPDGVLLAVMTTLPHGNYQQGEQVLAALRARGSAEFDALEAVSPVERALEARGAFDPTTGRPTIVWIGQPDAGPYGPPYTQQPQALRIATRER